MAAWRMQRPPVAQIQCRQPAPHRLGSIVVCADKALVYEEAPQAYKNIDSIIEAMRQAGLIEPIARLKPVLTYKTSGGCGE